MIENETTPAELLRYMQEFLPMKQDLERFATREDLQTMKTDVLTSVDGVCEASSDA